MIHSSNPGFLTPFEKGNGNQTCTYDECIRFYQKLDAAFDNARLFPYGTTSVGKPLHLLVISSNQDFDPQRIHASGKCVLLINNGIHPGEPDGIDASMMLARDLLTKRSFQPLLDHVVICIIPAYNISGMLNRSATSRANQNGPEAYGFRGTAQNYDLNRDFVKCDSREAQTFTEIFQTWKPEIFMDTHVSNGADYQYTMTLIPTQKDKLNPLLAAYQEQTLLPGLYDDMKQAGFEMTPYVNELKEIPDSGIVGFLETPRYSTGYAALFNCIGMMPETHMLKAYQPRVEATYSLELALLRIVARDHELIVRNKSEADSLTANQGNFTVAWKLNETKYESIDFKGYEAKWKPSEVSDSLRLWYDRSKPFDKPIRFFNDYDPEIKIEKPFAYLIPQAWERVVERMKWNGVAMKQLSKDTSLTVSVYYLDDLRSASGAYEGHHLNSQVQLHQENQTLDFYKGDWVVFPDQKCNRYIIEMLEPQATDSYFAWNFFDAILMEKEYFSDYVFEDLAAELLQHDTALHQQLEEKKKEDESFAKDPQAQLDFIYRHSPYFEQSYRRYPVARILNATTLPVQ